MNEKERRLAFVTFSKPLPVFTLVGRTGSFFYFGLLIVDCGLKKRH